MNDTDNNAPVPGAADTGPFPYGDILHLSHPEPQGHPRMPVGARAAQFGAFAALSGHDAAIARTAADHADSVDNPI